jgi:hypothetical protein
MNHAYLWDSASKAKSFVICCLSIGISHFRLQIRFPDIATLGLLKEGGRHSWWHFEMAWQQCGQKVLAECQAGTRRQYLGISPKVRTSKSSKHCHFFSRNTFRETNGLGYPNFEKETANLGVIGSDRMKDLHIFTRIAMIQRLPAGVSRLSSAARSIR